ncbi:MAG: hypothetical protein HY074_11430 [Deltaproteobacteria bacterium]|nr:hypothetical protein [Deltaproteobacteria bacterium]
MELLRRALALLILLGVGLPLHSAFAKFMPALNSLETVTNDSVSAGPNYNLGVSMDLALGSRDDPSNSMASLHGNYSRQMAPLDPTSKDTRLKDVNNFSSGVSINVLEKGVVGVDFDSASDRYESVFTNGFKITLGYEPIRLSYRYAGTTIEQTITPAPQLKNGKLVAQPNQEGAFIYQQTLALEGNFELSPADTLSPAVALATFSPGANLFANVLANNAGLQSLSTFTDTLQSFEQYSYGSEWRHYFDDTWGSKLGIKIVHEIITANTLFESSMGMGYRLSGGTHVQLGWDYSHDATAVQNILTLEFKVSWDRAATATP